MNCTVEQLSAIIAEKEHIALIGHFNPDGDAIGSVMGAFYFLKSIGKNAVPILPGPIPANLRYIDADDELVIYADKPSEARSAISRSDLIISLDFNSLGRTEWLEKIIRESNATKVLIDHHLSPVKEEFDFIISDTEVSSTCELLFYTLLAMPQAGGDPKKLPELSLTALASGMLTDTNNFNNSTGPGTFRMASMILEAGVDLSVLNDLIFKRYSENRIRLMGHLLSERMTIIPELGASCLVMTKEDKALFGYRDGDSEGFVNIPLTIDGVRVSALFTESSDYVRVSLRSKDGISVNRLSRLFFNGGGHEKAAGGRLYMPIGNVKDYFKSSLEQFLHAEGRAMKRVNNITSVLILSAIVCFSCTKEDKALTIADQEAKIESFITSRYPNNAVIRNNGSNRIIVDSCYKAEDPDKSPAYLAADTVAIGDTLRVFYAGYIFTSSPSTLFATNVETLATDAGFTLTDQDFSAKEIAYLPGVLISGLEKGFSGMREGEHCLILFSAKEGYYDKTLFNIPKMSALAYEIWVDEVIKKR